MCAHSGAAAVAATGRQYDWRTGRHTGSLQLLMLLLLLLSKRHTMHMCAARERKCERREQRAES